MPTYDYQCDACGTRFEKFQSIKAESLRKCPKCGKRRLRRLIGAGSGLIFKGSGFFATDYRSEAYKKSEKSETPAPAGAAATGKEKPEATGGESKTGAKSGESKPAEAKPAASSEPKPAKKARE